jgi:hypothetical protein
MKKLMGVRARVAVALVAVVWGVGAASGWASEGLIAGPAAVRIGELAVFEAQGSDGARYAWLVAPATPHFLVVDGGRRAVLTSPVAGKFTVVLAVAGGEVLEQAALEVEIGGAGPVPPGPTPPGPGPGPPGPTPPGPGPTGFSETVAKQARLVKSASRNEEAKRLAQSFATMAELIRTGAITGAERIVPATAASNRTALGEAATAAWGPFFDWMRTELNARAAQGALDYAALWRDAARGLEASNVAGVEAGGGREQAGSGKGD